MKTKIIIAALAMSTFILAAQENNTKVTVRIKKVETINGKEKTTDTTYTMNGPVRISDTDISMENSQIDGKEGMVIITDTIMGKGDYVTIGGIGEVVDAQIEKTLNGLDIDKANIKKTIVINVDNTTTEEKQELKSVKVVIVKSMIVLDPSLEDTRLLGKAAGLPDNKLSVEKMEFYPNPNTGKFNLRFQLSDKGTAAIKIFATDGKTIYSEELKNFNGTYDKEIDISEHPKGIYFVKIQQNGHSQLKKLVLQ